MILRPIRPSLVVAAVLLCWRASASTDFVFNLSGKRLAGAEVCFYPLPPTGKPPFDALTSAEVECLSADDLIILTVGRWGFFGRHQKGFVTHHPASVTVTQENREDTYSAIKLDLVPAATLDFSAVLPALDEREHFAVLVGETDSRPATVLPLALEDRTLLVPAQTPLVIVTAAGGKPARVATPQPLVLAPGATHLVEGRFAGNVVMTAFAPPLPRADPNAGNLLSPYADAVDRLSAPRLFLRASSGAAIAPAIPISRARSLEQAVVMFSNVPAGSFEIELDDPLWERDVVHGSASNEGVAIADPIAAVPGAVAHVRWSDWPVETASCTEDDLPPHEVSVWTCPAATAALPALERCTIEARQSTTGRSVTFPSLPAGANVVAIERKGAQRVLSLQLRPGQEVSAEFPSISFPIYGKVTRSGRPVHATVDFGGSRTAADPFTGEFRVELPGSSWQGAVRVLECPAGDQIFAFATSLLGAGERLDIEIPDDDFTVRILDARDDRPVKDASVFLGATRDGEPGHRFSLHETSADDGTARFRNIAPDQAFDLLVRHENYRDKRTRVRSSRERPVTIALERQESHRGRIAGMDNVVGGRLYWVDAGGIVTEVVDIEPDGGFTFRERHTADSYVVVASHSHPLLVAPARRTDMDSVVIEFAAAPIAAFDVRIADPPRASAWIALRVGGRLVPLTAFAHHQMARGLQAVLQGNLQVRDILASDPIEVIRGPDPASYPPHYPPPDRAFADATLRNSMPVKLVSGPVVAFP